MQDNPPCIKIMKDPYRSKLVTVCPSTVNAYIMHYKAWMLNYIPWKNKIRLIRTIVNGNVIHKAKESQVAGCRINSETLMEPKGKIPKESSCRLKNKGPESKRASMTRHGSTRFKVRAEVQHNGIVSKHQNDASINKDQYFERDLTCYATYGTTVSDGPESKANTMRKAK